MPKPGKTMGARMIEKCHNLMHLPDTTNAQRKEALRELLEWASEELHHEHRWEEALAKRRVVRTPSPQT